MGTSSDRIEDRVRLRAPRARVWKALTDVEEFGRWFGVKLDGSFSPGARVGGKVLHEGYENLTFELVVDRIEPEHRFSWRWHPYAVDPAVDYSAETPTHVVFELEEVPGGTALSVTETGFDRLPVSRREEAYREHRTGWKMQMQSIEEHLRKAA